MPKSVEKCKTAFLEHTLEMLWQLWSQLGIAGQGTRTSYLVVDVEALILATCFWGRYDPRLFDEMIAWLRKNERFVNIHRLRYICRKYEYAAFCLLGPVSCYLFASSQTPKWKSIQKECMRLAFLSEPQNLFLFPDNKFMPVHGETDRIFAEYKFLRSPFKDRELAGTFPLGPVASLQLQLRAFFGVNSRSETILYLLLHEVATIRQIATYSCYSWHSIQETLFELAHSGIVSHPEAKRGRKYRLNRMQWSQLFPAITGKMAERNMVVLFRALELIWLRLTDDKVARLSPDGLDIEIKELFRRQINPLFAESESSMPHINLDQQSGNNFLEAALKALSDFFENIVCGETGVS